MTTLDLAAQASGEVVCSIDGRCSCPTCGIAAALLKGALASRGATIEQRNRVSARGEDFRGGSNPALAYIYVQTSTGDRQVARIAEVQDVLQENIIADVLAALEA